MSGIRERIENLIEESCKKLKYQGFKEEEIRYDVYLNLRYDRTNCALMILKEGSSWDFETPFIRKVSLILFIYLFFNKYVY